jgi:hypothetical protein
MATKYPDFEKFNLNNESQPTEAGYFTTIGLDSAIIAFRCECSYITGINQKYCWRCGTLRHKDSELLYGRDFGPTGAVRKKSIPSTQS